MGNSVTKADLVSAIATETGLKKVDAERALLALTNAIQGALRGKKKVTLVGFGTFSVVERQEKMGRDPRDSSKPIRIPKHNAVKFSAGGAMRDAVNP